jgi:hypothetical protein
MDSRAHRFIELAVAFLMLAVGCEVPPTPENVATLTGRATTEAGVPIERVSVCVIERTPTSSSAWPCALTNRLGEYELKEVPLGHVSVEFSREGLIPKLVTETVTRESRVDAMLSQGFRVSGIVVGPAGAAGNAHVWIADHHLKTDSKGHFVIGGLASGPNTVRAIHQDGEASFSIAVPHEASLTIKVAPPPSGVLSGSILGAPEDAHVELLAIGEDREKRAVSQGGAYRFDKAPTGDVEIHARGWTTRLLIFRESYYGRGLATVRAGEETHANVTVERVNWTVMGL